MPRDISSDTHRSKVLCMHATTIEKPNGNLLEFDEM